MSSRRGLLGARRNVLSMHSLRSPFSSRLASPHKYAFVGNAAHRGSNIRSRVQSRPSKLQTSARTLNCGASSRDQSGCTARAGVRASDARQRTRSGSDSRLPPRPTPRPTATSSGRGAGCGALCAVAPHSQPPGVISTVTYRHSTVVTVRACFSGVKPGASTSPASGVRGPGPRPEYSRILATAGARTFEMRRVTSGAACLARARRRRCATSSRVNNVVHCRRSL
ncbi:hypothetical protein C2E23DRAFT_139057 [Lenzites betulinus]|nr:hypothetical protein C2E23DRAFT_139057 [Lenzites betulinus]